MFDVQPIIKTKPRRQIKTVAATENQKISLHETAPWGNMRTKQIEPVVRACNHLRSQIQVNMFNSTREPRIRLTNNLYCLHYVLKGQLTKVLHELKFIKN